MNMGLNERFSAGLSPSFQHVIGEYFNASGSGKDKNDAFVSSDVFLKTKMYESKEQGIALSLITLAEIPGIYKEQTTPFFGKQETFWNVGPAIGKSLYNIGSNYGYVNFETSYRSRVSQAFTDEGGRKCAF